MKLTPEQIEEERLWFEANAINKNVEPHCINRFEKMDDGRYLNPTMRLAYSMWLDGYHRALESQSEKEIELPKPWRTSHSSNLLHAHADIVRNIESQGFKVKVKE